MGSINVDWRGLGRNDIRSKREIQIDGAQGIMWFVCPASMNVMTPAHRQFNVDVLFNAGMLHNRTVGDPGTQGAGVAGMQKEMAAEHPLHIYWISRLNRISVLKTELNNIVFN